MLHVETYKITYHRKGDDAYVGYVCELKSFIFLIMNQIYDFMLKIANLFCFYCEITNQQVLILDYKQMYMYVIN